jgi:hypothetical protein
MPFLGRITPPLTGVRGSWRRAVVIALVRSELSADVLPRAEEHLLADSGGCCATRSAR